MDYFLATDKLGHFGDFIGGFLGTFLTIIATVYVFKTYQSQKSELEEQRKLIQQQQFESTFFNMLNVHRELKNNLFVQERLFWFTDDQVKDINLTFVKDVKLFNEIIREREKKGLRVFKSIRLDLCGLYSSDKINKQISFYNNFELLKDNIYTKSLANKLEIYNKKIFFLDDSQTILNNSFELIFEIYQDVISHYCRNVYHILKFLKINEDNKTLGKEKSVYRNYADIFQSQLNVDEQFLLFYNFIYFDKEITNGSFGTVDLTNHYSFLENIGIDNLIEKEHELYYNFKIKGSDREI